MPALAQHGMEGCALRRMDAARDGAPIDQPAVQRLGQQRGPGGAQQRDGGIVGADDAFVLDQQQPTFDRIEQRGLLVEDQVQAALAGLLDDAVGNLARAHAGQAQRIGVHAPGVARDIQHAEDLAARRTDRRRVAAEDLVAPQEVFGAVHAQRGGFDQRRADGVGAAMVFGPADPGPQRHVVGALQEPGIAACLQDHAAGVGQQHQAGGAGHHAGQGFDFGLGGAQHAGVLLEAFLQVAVAQGDGVVVQVGGGAGAALPGAHDGSGGLRGRQVLAGCGKLVAGHAVSPCVSRAATRCRRRQRRPVARCDKPLFFIGKLCMKSACALAVQR
ncbi:Uncharacterised protein [Bordetella pertussis]|nr:Uncharacterised protein [Bordetella pertussis]